MRMIHTVKHGGGCICLQLITHFCWMTSSRQSLSCAMSFSFLKIMHLMLYKVWKIFNKQTPIYMLCKDSTSWRCIKNKHGHEKQRLKPVAQWWDGVWSANLHNHTLTCPKKDAQGKDEAARLLIRLKFFRRTKRAKRKWLFDLPTLENLFSFHHGLASSIYLWHP